MSDSFKKLTICVAGKNDVACNVLARLNDDYSGGCRLVVVCNFDDDGKNKWQNSLKFTSIKKMCR